MLKGTSHFWLSVAIHLMILSVISLTTVNIDKNTNKIQPIKSYLYQQPKNKETQLTPINHETDSTLSSQHNKQTINTVKEPENIKETTPLPNTSVAKPTNNEKSPTSQPVLNTSENMFEKKKILQSPLSTKTFSAIEAINEKRDQAMFESATQLGDSQAKGSIFNPNPALVPHSTVTINEDEKRKNATQTLGGGIEMIKGEDGTCYVERDLSSIGMNGVTSRESFACGLSEFDKAFNTHMKKLKNKMGK